ncbi:hypothetical protein [Rhizobium sp. SSA_523]|uniref:hypothetical protein n=1 Tax=Rhizobium sp. SSA_523 TaxID=2952477 RepID=UPI0020910AA6|nr:hypothetical protein [Rhizobium sp. SSA_523]MCO5732062.1 hypothetical protein [Rhizobium sp. SSA_523]WKC22601.1 hypothetical protein QTJ18_17210 [Rhizobium sp. SSA_523]
MIEFALLFGLGFLSATLIVMVMAPAVHRRVVRYTENRLKATMPISPSEVRAQRDLARAVYAAENARTKQELITERDRAVAMQIRFDKLASETTDLHAANHDLQMQVDDMSTEAADLRSRLRREEGFILQLKQSLALVETTLEAKNAETEALQARIGRLLSDVDALKVELATRDAELASVSGRTETLREERQMLRTDVKLLTARAKNAEAQLQEEKRRLARLDEKLIREVAAKADLLARLERREEQLSRLQGREKAVSGELWQPVTGSYPLPRGKKTGAEAKAAAALIGPPGPPEPDGLEEEPAASDVASEAPIEAADEGAGGSESAIGASAATALDMAEDMAADPASAEALDLAPAPVSIDLTRFADDIRNRSAALSAQLPKSKNRKTDEALRQELAHIAADLVALTAAREGEASPIPALLASDETGPAGAKRQSLARRARTTYRSLVPPADGA